MRCKLLRMMSSFQLRCPNCNATLELPIEADGKSSICPACEHQFVARISDAAAPETPTESAIQDEPLSLDAMEFHKVTIESIVSDTQAAFVHRRRPLLVPFLAPSALLFFGVLIPAQLISDLTATNGKKAAVIGLVLLPIILAEISYAVWFALNLAIDVSDAGPKDPEAETDRVKSWFVPRFATYARVFCVTALISVFATILLGLAIAIIRLSFRFTSVGAQSILLATGFVVLAAISIFLTMRLWPMIPLAMRRTSLTNSVRISLRMSGKNLMTSFFLSIVAFLLLGVGFGLLGIGIPLTAPITALLLEVAYRLIRGKRIPAFENQSGPGFGTNH